jgi:hypothetical protein
MLREHMVATNQQEEAQTRQSSVSSMKKRESNLKNSSRVILNQPRVLFSASGIRNATGPVPLAPDPTLSNGRTSSLATRRKF